MKIVIASDHAGFETKQKVLENFKNKFELVDFGPSTDERTDYPDYADKVASHVARGSGDIGILICGSGQGMAMRANKYPQIRAALCWSEETAQLARAHNDANILCLGGRVLDFALICKIIDAFLAATFEGGRHADRVKKIALPLK